MTPEDRQLIREMNASISAVEDAVIGLTRNVEQGMNTLNVEIGKLQTEAGTNSRLLELRRDEIETGFRTTTEQLKHIRVGLDHIQKNGCTLRCPPPEIPEEHTIPSLRAIAGE